MIKWYWLFAFIVGLSQFGNAQIITGISDGYYLNGYIQIYKENKTPLKPLEAARLYCQNKFKKVKAPNNNLNLGFAKSIYWVAIPVENRTNLELRLESGIAKSGIFNIRFHQFNPEDSTFINWPLTGASHDFNSRAVKSRFYFFPLKLKPGQKALLLYQIDQRGGSLHAPFRLYNSKFRQDSEWDISLVYSFFSGLILFVSFFSFISYIWFHERIYLYYSLYAFFSCMFILSDSNLASVWIYPSWQPWNSISTSMYAGWLAACRLSFTSNFLHLKSSQKRMYRLIQLWILFMLVLTILIPPFFAFPSKIEHRVLVYIFGVICFLGEWVMHATAIGTMVLNKYKPAYLYGLSILSVFVISIIYNIKSLNLAYVDELPYYYFPLGLTIEIIILSLALVYKFNFHRKKHTELKLNFQKEILKTQLEIQEQTFQDISQEIHDNIGQVLSLVKLNIKTLRPSEPIESMEKIKQSDVLLTRAIQDLRELSHGLNTDYIKDLGLVKAIEHQLLALRKTKLYTTNLTIAGPIISYGDEVELVLFRIIQELINNTVKHAQANRVDITILFNSDSLFIKIADNGKGFNVDAIKKRSNHGIGLINIEKRITLINGICQIESYPGTGTRVSLTLVGKH